MATYNIGARTDEHYMSEARKPKFMAKLREDLAALKDCDILGLQEVSPLWCDFLVSEMPDNWGFCYHRGATVMTMWNKDRLVLEVAETPRVFPSSTSKFREWRTCLLTTLASTQGLTITVVNNHTIDGQGDRKLQSEKMAIDALKGCVEAGQTA